MGSCRVSPIGPSSVTLKGLVYGSNDSLDSCGLLNQVGA